MEELLRVDAGDVLESGIFPALPDKAPILWADAENVQFASGMVRKTQGYLGLVNTPARPTGMKAAQTISERRLYLGAGGAYYQYRTLDGLTALKSGLSGGGVWIMVPMGEHLLSSNGIDGLRYWDGAVDQQITTPFDYALTVARFRKQVFASNTNLGANHINRCDVDDPLDWTPVPLNDASLIVANDIDGGWISSQPLSTVLGMYTQASMYILSFIGGTEFYSLRPAVQGVGALSHYSVVSVGSLHYGLLQNRAFICDGVTFSDIDLPAVRRWMERNVNWDRYPEVYGWHDRLNSMVRWQVPYGASPGMLGLGYNYNTKRWHKFNDSVLIGEEAGVWANAFVAKEARLLSLTPSEEDNDGAALSAYVTTKHLDFGKREMFKALDKLEFSYEKTGTVEVQIGWAESPNDPITWNATAYPLESQVFPALDEQREGVHMAFRVRSTTVGASWTISGFAVHGEFTGYVN